MQVAKWGNSLAVRLPRALVDALKLEAGDEIEITVAGARRFEVERDRGASRRSLGSASSGAACLPDSNSTGPRRMSAADVFFDTNVLLYLLSEDAAKADRAESLLASGGMISVQVLNEFASLRPGKLSMKFSEIKEVVATIRAVCTVKPIDVETHELGLDLAEQYRFSIYDSFIVAAALRAGCSTRLSEDLQSGQKIDTLTIHNPFAE